MKHATACDIAVAVVHEPHARKSHDHKVHAGFGTLGKFPGAVWAPDLVGIGSDSQCQGQMAVVE